MATGIRTNLAWLKDSEVKINQGIVVDEHLRESGILLKVRLSLASNEAIRELVASGMGLTVLSRQALGVQPEQDGLACLDVAGFPLKRKWSVVHLRTKILSLPAKAFLDDLLRSGTASLPTSRT